MSQSIRDFLLSRGCKEDGNRITCPTNVLNDAVERNIDLRDITSIDQRNSKHFDVVLKENK